MNSGMEQIISRNNSVVGSVLISSTLRHQDNVEEGHLIILGGGQSGKTSWRWLPMK